MNRSLEIATMIVSLAFFSIAIAWHFSGNDQRAIVDMLIAINLNLPFWRPR